MSTDSSFSVHGLYTLNVFTYQVHAGLAFTIRCTVPTPTPRSEAIRRIPFPLAFSLRIARSTAVLMGGRPSRLPWCPSRKYVLPDILDLFQRRRQSGVLGHC